MQAIRDVRRQQIPQRFRKRKGEELALSARVAELCRRFDTRGPRRLSLFNEGELSPVGVGTKPKD